MSKGSSYWSTATGKIGNTVVSIINGQRIERAYQPNVKNPRTKSQTLQRATFAAQVKFYKVATANFFKFAFEDKKQTESDYNAFMRNNRGVGMVMNRTAYLNVNYPAIGNRFMLSKGSLAEPKITNVLSSLVINVTNVTESQNATIGEVSTALISNYGLQDGDIVTIVKVHSEIEDIKDEPDTPTDWTIKQFVIDPSNTTKASTVSIDGVAVNIEEDKITNLVTVGDDQASGGTIIFSRKTTDGLKVSDSYLYLNDVAQTVYNDSLQTSFRNAALTSWGATEEAILEGSLVQG